MYDRTYHFERYRLNCNINKAPKARPAFKSKRFVYVRTWLHEICVIYRENPVPLFFFFCVLVWFVLSLVGRAHV